ncbi:quinone-dependent dihydroorotate dehydrogenase [Isoalcanivorax beigongshangi]|uniref:Dihydroorotate dehydrogenase (quinone) n=1 Tax=Isoalcanivorax beigongshangi TaxID=3238810 RepID=A0ABV4AGX4_9GAMM
MLYRVARPLLFALPEETVHDLTLTLLRQGGGRLLAPAVADKPVQVMGLRFPNPVGLAAGLDKNGDCIDGLAALGFGFIEVGTVTPRAQAGNPKPRLFRLPEAQALINRMGFNNKGVDYLLAAVRRRRFDGVLGINIGKNASTPVEQAVDDYLYCLERVHAEASYVVVNVSSPNTAGLRALQHGDALERLLETLRARQTELDQRSGRRVPLVIKIAPDNDADTLGAMAEAFVRHGMDGVIVSNTTIERPQVGHLARGKEQGGLSGAPLKPLADQALSTVVSALNGALPVIGVGGIQSGTDAADKQQRGAALVQLYSGLIYQGPALIKDAVDGWR